MKLNLSTRLTILTNLPEQGSLVDQINKRHIKEMFNVSAEDMEFYGIKEGPNGSIVWDAAKDAEKPMEVEFTEEQLKYMKKVCTMLDEQEKITEPLIDFVQEIYELTKE